ncbi:DUF2339 domain-containing protein [Pseudonocardia sp. WMMC193]|nr:DUF2339 domain-containing protein [Pseudonocardia sp. WMMC193]MCF7551993.1 DUF2339 domain-containing protein [Pseudonocardia sp. WMMC193]
MTTPTGRPPAVDERVHAVAVELGQLAHRVATLGDTLNLLVGELRAPQPTAPAGVAVRPAGPHAEPPPGPPADAPGPFGPPRVSGPAGWAPPAGVPWTPGPAFQYAVPAGPRRPTWVDRLRTVSSAALLATIGGAVTLLGVVLLLVLAASRGWFGPTARVAAGAALGIVLIGLGMWLHRGRTRATVGAQALAGTGVAALFLSLAAAAALYDLVPDLVAGGLAMVVAAGGLALADRWGSRPLAVGVVVGAGVLTPFVADGPTVLTGALALVLQIVCAPVVLRRGWAAPAVVTAVWSALYCGVAAAASDAGWTRLAALALVALVVGVAAAVAVVLGPAGRAGSRQPAAAAAVLAAAAVPVLAVVGRGDGPAEAWPALLAALVLAAFAVWRTPSAGVRATATAVAGLAVLIATVTALRGTPQHLVLVGEAAVLLVAAAGLRSRALLAVGGAFGLVGLVSVLGAELRVDAVVGSVPFRGLPAAVVAGLLLLAAAVAALVAAGRVGLVRADAGTAVLWAPTALVALYGATGAVVAAALLVSGGSGIGFLAGHAVVTVSWTVAALVLLARGVTRPALRVAGLVLVAAAVGKLVLFDLVALDGLARVAAFLGAGLVLLAAGSRYARLVARHERDD